MFYSFISNLTYVNSVKFQGDSGGPMMAFGNERWEQFGIAMADIGDGPCVSPGRKLFQSKICVLMLFTNNLENKIL